MKKVTLFAVLALVSVGLIGVFATNVYAHPAFGEPCTASGCHATDDPRIVPAPAGDPEGLIPTSTVDATCAVTSCNVVSAYRGTATFNLAACDNEGGWGVGYVYYKLDDGPVRLVRNPVDWDTSMGAMECETTLTVLAPASGTAEHTVQYWSQDNYGNVESRQSSTFTVAAPTKMAMSIRASASSIYRRHYVTISGTVEKPGVDVVLYVKAPGSSTYKAIKTLTTSDTGAWSYRSRPSHHGSYYFKVQFAGDNEWLASSSTSKRVYVK